uniref:ubiquitinyl hydrolase 1 n=1 Tax=Amphimedon queenslandica TaxID=400682 RepID=A0A1X7SQ13_AMPQE
MSMVNESDSPQLLCHKAEIVPTLSLTLTTTDNKDGSEKTKEVLTKNDEPQDLSAITSVLQCLIHTKPLKSFIVKSRGKKKYLLNDKMSVPEIIMSQPEYLKLAIEQQDAQELISVLINGLHEEFNQVTGEKPYVDMKVDESKCSSEEEIAAAWKKLTELRDKSEIINIFHAQVKTTLRCGKCSYAQKSYDSLFPLSLPLPRKESRLTLTSCLRLFMREEQLSNSKKCKNCHDNCKHFRKADILKLPPILVVYLKRFHFLESGMTKIEKPVEFSCKFPIQEYYPNAHDDIEYKLYAVINHYGSLECGYCE